MSDPRVISGARYIEAHADEALSLERLARIVSLSKAHIQKRFKAVMGLSPKAYQDAIRQARLKALLKENEGISRRYFRGWVWLDLKSLWRSRAWSWHDA